MSRRECRGFTLLELLVVLIVLAVAATLAVPALSRGRADEEPALAALLLGAREAAARRGETVRLSISKDGGWRIAGGDGAIQSGEVVPFPGLPLTLIVSPMGSCGFEGGRVVDSVRVDPLTCTLLD